MTDIFVRNKRRIIEMMTGVTNLDVTIDIFYAVKLTIPVPSTSKLVVTYFLFDVNYGSY